MKFLRVLQRINVRRREKGLHIKRLRAMFSFSVLSFSKEKQVDLSRKRRFLIRLKDKRATFTVGVRILNHLRGLRSALFNRNKDVGSKRIVREYRTIASNVFVFIRSNDILIFRRVPLISRRRRALIVTLSRLRSIRVLYLSAALNVGRRRTGI